MSGDYTRFTFDPTKAFSGVHKQQGRVSLDADFNEFEEILDRRDRSEMYDTVGQAVVPATTPDGFAIGVDGAGKLTIGIGRVYVDGVQAECFGDMSDPKLTVYDPNIGDLVGSGPLPFDAQLFAYTTGFPTISPTPGVDNLLYLDVWQREVTVWEDPSLLDPALGGPDTATRVQTAWQVKALTDVAADACTNAPGTWTDLIAPSTARMTAAASPAPPAPGPCVIQPAGGYTGLENRLYRVEVHDAGTLGGAPRATFKWSRDNASLVASVLKVVKVGAVSVITVESTGRDSWMRFEVSQQIELLDDLVEFAMRESGTAGKVARITGVNHATGEITIDQDLSTYLVINKDHHPRIRRWDTAAPADDAVRDVNNGTPIPLEDGIFVTFGDLLAGPLHDTDTLHAGDYWVFAARTADGSIEAVLNEPPRGILHHYMQLAVVTSGAPPTVVDCRDPWPVPCDCEGGGCDCDACVSVESHVSGALTIQMAIDQVIAAGGGTVCIGIGSFPIVEKGIVIAGAVSLRVRGSGIATILEYRGQGPALLVESSLDVAVRDLSVITERDPGAPQDAVEVVDAAMVTLERLVVIEDPIGILEFLEKGSATRPMGGAVGLGGFVLRTTVRDCILAGGAGVLSRHLITEDKTDYLVVADLAIDRDLVFATAFGVALGSPEAPGLMAFLDRTAITASSIYGCEEAGVLLAGAVIEGEIIVRDDTLGVIGRGMALTTDRTTIDGNTVASWQRRRPRSGISIIRGDQDAVRDVRLERNRVARFGLAGISVEASVVNLAIAVNTIGDCGGGIVMSRESSGDTIDVSGNSVTDIDSRGEQEDGRAYGIALVDTIDGRIVDNTVKRIAVEDFDSRWRAGIQTVACRAVRVAGNVVDEVGPTEFGGVSVGIGAAYGFERLDVLDNAVRPGVERSFGAWYALLIGEADEPWTKAPIAVGAAIWTFAGPKISMLASHERPSAAAVRGNHLDSAGRVPTVEVRTLGSCTFSDNWCRQATEGIEPVVEMELAILALTSNQVRQQANDGSVAIAVRVGGALLPKPPSLAISALGNITDGRIFVNGSDLPAPWRPLNVRLT